MCSHGSINGNGNCGYCGKYVGWNRKFNDVNIDVNMTIDKEKPVETVHIRNSQQKAVDQLHTDELSYLILGKPIYAIKAYRERTGTSLIEAKRLIDAAMGKVVVPGWFESLKVDELVAVEKSNECAYDGFVGNIYKVMDKSYPMLFVKSWPMCNVYGSNVINVEKCVIRKVSLT